MNYPLGANEDPNAHWNEDWEDENEDEDFEPDPDSMPGGRDDY